MTAYTSPEAKQKLAAARTQADREAAKAAQYFGIDPYENRDGYTVYWTRVLASLSGNA